MLRTSHSPIIAENFRIGLNGEENERALEIDRKKKIMFTKKRTEREN